MSQILPMTRRALLCTLLLTALLVAGPGTGAGAAQAAAAGPPDLIVLAASSLTDALNEIGPAFTAATHRGVKLSYAASSALARQIEAGAPADVFMSADTEWMNYLQTRNLIDTASRHNVLGNSLVLISPADSTVSIRIRPHFGLAKLLGSGRLATGNPDSVPVGKYAKAALTNLGVWSEVQDKVAPTDNVRAALALVARGEAPLGIVYRTDALVEKKVRIVATFPGSSHEPITYPVATTAHPKQGAADFVKFLASPAARTIFAKYGFDPAPK
ncbi:MAG TPA: molybdate ABC transporter substrate-binding protein [Steroidobacteraceae bacterium]|nr:molybdate ABC transporter substrate-binding protein [Steroidobacteraceae bacterium]